MLQQEFIFQCMQSKSGSFDFATIFLSSLKSGYSYPYGLFATHFEKVIKRNLSLFLKNLSKHIFYQLELFTGSESLEIVKFQKYAYMTKINLQQKQRYISVIKPFYIIIYNEN
ncbi:unnamed protein product [Paramecium octaurelia]|uniref:Uncharacterized protein n=1 Tax=Paramecium octaurelia TaxID=43137 RepID=A0A8S1YB14_PAROT|nr:unnamed protein product [Paramecium octaurelia]